MDDTTRFAGLIRPLEQPCQYHKHRVRALRPAQGDDSRLLEASQRGEFALNGLRNCDLQRLLCDSALQDPEQRRRSAAVSRTLRLPRVRG